MNFDRTFRILSYAAVLCGFLSLWITGTFGIAGTLLFTALFVTAWLLEGTRFQINDKLGTVAVVLALPAYYFAWRAGMLRGDTSEATLAGVLARLILTLTVIKLLQKKSDRDWIFLYMMAFFEVLLAAGFSISAFYFASFVLYAFVMISTIIVFEMRKTELQTRSAAALKDAETPHFAGMRPRRVPLTAVVLLVLIGLLAMPMFFLLPRVGGAGLGGSGSRGMATYSGFSDSVRLGGIGQIQQNDEVVMRVRIDSDDRERLGGRIRWRGVSLDTFTGKSWSKSKITKEVHQKNDLDLIQLALVRDRSSIIAQTVYLEPLDSPVLFVLPRGVGVQGNFPMLFTDRDDSVTFQPRTDRISYKALSDVSQPPESQLRSDREPYPESAGSYLQLPRQADPRIHQLAAEITANARNRYDAARAVEQYLQTQLGYTLEQKAGGDDPLADFLFNVREGHCEYFATAMAIMLRTQGIATRVVNGFTQGSYNETADMLVVRQRNAHSWVEVYFPGEQAWVTFDPTPAAGQDPNGGDGSSFAITERFNKYVEAVEAYWIQYFVAFDNQEQRSMFSSIRRSVRDYGTKTAVLTDGIQAKIESWWSDLRGDQGARSRLRAVGFAALYAALALIAIALFVWLYRKVVKLEVWRRLWERLFAKRQASIVEFYERMTAVLAGKGLVREPHQTPLEFAFEVGMPEAVKITEKYNRVRFGEQDLSRDESEEVEEWLEGLSATNYSNGDVPNS